MLLGYLQFVIMLLTFRPQIVHINSSFGFSFYRKLFYIYISKLFSKKVVNHIHGAEFDKFFVNTSERKKTQIRRAYNKCDCLIALSDEWKDNLKQIVDDKKIVVIENYSIIHVDEPLVNDCATVLFLGEIGTRKGCLDIPDVVKLVSSRLNKCRFVLAGNIIEDDFKIISDKISEYGISEHIFFPGWVRGDEKDKLLREADLFFLPSYNEGMPMSVLDAMGYGLPIVSTDIGGIPQIVKNEMNGYIFRPGDVEGFAHAITSILCKREIRLEFGKNSLKIIKESYSLDRHIEKLEEVYTLVCCEGGEY